MLDSPLDGIRSPFGPRRGGLVQWLLEFGVWNRRGIWLDAATWNDGV